MFSNERFRFFQAKLQNDEKKIKTIFIIEGIATILILANMTYLNFTLWKNIQTTESQTINTTTTVPSPTESPSLSLSPTSKPTQSPSQQTPVVINQQPQIKEYFVPFGTGTNQTNDWANVPGAQATIDFGAYNGIKQITFEASVVIPTANQQVWVRLYNVSDNHPVWNSEVMMDGGSSAYLISQPIIYDTGSKMYQVQMKTQLAYQANLTQSRIHIILH